jgi:hypothetical protein
MQHRYAAARSGLYYVLAFWQAMSAPMQHRCLYSILVTTASIKTAATCALCSAVAIVVSGLTTVTVVSQRVNRFSQPSVNQLDNQSLRSWLSRSEWSQLGPTRSLPSQADSQSSLPFHCATGTQPLRKRLGGGLSHYTCNRCGSTCSDSQCCSGTCSTSSSASSSAEAIATAQPQQHSTGGTGREQQHHRRPGHAGS